MLLTNSAKGILTFELGIVKRGTGCHHNHLSGVEQLLGHLIHSLWDHCLNFSLKLTQFFPSQSIHLVHQNFIADQFGIGIGHYLGTDDRI